MLKFKKEHLIIAITAAIGIIILAVYLVLFAPLTKKLGTEYLECRSCEADVIDVRNIIKTAGEVYGVRVLMTEQDVLHAINELTGHSKFKGVDIISMHPEEIIEKEEKGARYKILPVKMQIESTYEELGIFLGSLDDLEKGLVKVKSFKIVQDEKNQSNFITNLVVNVYLSAR